MKTKTGIISFAVLLLALFFVIPKFACSDPDREVPVIYTDEDYALVMAQVIKLTNGPFTKPEDAPLTSEEEHNLRVGSIKVKGLIGYKPIYSNYFISGKIAFLLGDYPTAQVYFDQCIRSEWPQDTSKDFYFQTLSEAHYLLSKCFFFQNEYQQAADEARLAAERVPQSLGYKYAEAQAEAQLRHDTTAIGLLQDILRVDPGHTKAKLLLNQILADPSKG